MKETNYERQLVTCRVHVVNRGQAGGPHRLQLGIQSQPGPVQDWPRGQMLIGLEQPDPDSNLTIIYLMFLKPGTPKPSFVSGIKFQSARMRRNKNKEVLVAIKTRYTRTRSHPLPLGQYSGIALYDSTGQVAVLTVQAGTLRKAPEPSEPKTIITPGDQEFGKSLANAKRTLYGVDGLARRRVDAGGFCDG